jgi:hypothetical protein
MMSIGAGEAVFASSLQPSQHPTASKAPERPLPVLSVPANHLTEEADEMITRTLDKP